MLGNLGEIPTEGVVLTIEHSILGLRSGTIKSTNGGPSQTLKFSFLSFDSSTKPDELKVGDIVSFTTGFSFWLGTSNSVENIKIIQNT